MSAPGTPIVIAGMHRSGTTLLLDPLREVGCFFGARLVYVRRSGVDMAGSLMPRALARLHHPLEAFERHLYTSRWMQALGYGDRV